jgi:predicted deacylase
MTSTILMLFLLPYLLASAVNRSLYNYAELENRITALTNGSSGKIRVFQIGTTHAGRKIYCIKVTGTSSESGREKKLLIIGGTHSLEWPGYEVGIRFAEALARGLKEGIQPYGTVYIIPAVNPDGFNYMQYIPHTYFNARKNREFPPGEKNWRVYTLGVDINRNFPVAWKSNRNPWDVFYGGEKPASEPETIAVMELTEKVKPDFAISLHSPGRNILYPWSHTREKLNDAALIDACNEFCRRVGWGFKVEQDAMNYLKFGSELDWFYGGMHIPCFRLEIARDLETYTLEEYNGIESAFYWLINEYFKK